LDAISDERTKLLATYATAAGWLYGVLGIDEFVEVFNHYEDEKTTHEEFMLLMDPLTEIDVVLFCTFDGLLAGAHYSNYTSWDLENTKSVHEKQQDRPRYLPYKEEFLRYAEESHFEPMRPYDDLKAYILGHGIVQMSEENLDEMLVDLREKTQLGISNKDLFYYILMEMNCQFDGLPDFNDFLQVVIYACNRTRMHDINGFTPVELSEYYEHAGLWDQKPYHIFEIPVFGNNDPCPCGSGKTFKECHGQRFRRGNLKKRSTMQLIKSFFTRK
jgi:hypothetical protein